MQYRQAIRLHNEDEVTIKDTGEILHVVTVENHSDATPKYCEILCENGNLYLHTDIKIGRAHV